MGKVHLITGYAGEEHIHSADQGSFNASFFGGGEYVMEAGNQLEASIMDNNTVRILDGDLLMQGRHIRIDVDTYEDITITTGTAGVNRNDLIVMQYSKDTSTDIETAELVVIKGTETEGTASDPEYTSGDILAGASFNQMPLYRVKVEGVVLTAVEPLFTTIPTYKKLAEQYAKQFEEACSTYLGALNILDTKEEIEANTKENQLAGALALKEVIASISDIVNNQVTTRYIEETDMWQMKTVSDGVWHDWAGGGLSSKIISLLTANAVWDKSHTDTSYATSNTVTVADGSVEFSLTVSAGNGVEYSYTLPDEIYAVNATELDFGGTTSGSPASTKHYLQLSTNKTDWSTVATITGNSGFEHSVDISGYERFYVRFVIKMNNTGKSLVNISTLQYS